MLGFHSGTVALHTPRSDHDFAGPVLETFRQSGIDPAQAVIFGGAVLALHGIRPAHDVDVIVWPYEVERLEAQGSIKLASGAMVPLERVRRTYPYRLRTPSGHTLPLPLDITTILDDCPDGEEPDGDTLANAFKNVVLTAGVPHMPLADVLALKRKSLRPKDRLDVVRASMPQLRLPRLESV